MRAELKLRVQEALYGMDAQDREVLTLRHFEEWSNTEAGRVLGIKPSAAVNR
jgi:RNA polymerase sigma-70 factor (ECF subfamily)